MDTLLNKLLALGPVVFGVLMFAPVSAALLDHFALTLPGGIANLHFTLVLGFCWGLLALLRGRWL